MGGLLMGALASLLACSPFPQGPSTHVCGIRYVANILYPKWLWGPYICHHIWVLGPSWIVLWFSPLSFRSQEDCPRMQMFLCDLGRQAFIANCRDPSGSRLQFQISTMGTATWLFNKISKIPRNPMGRLSWRALKLGLQKATVTGGSYKP